MGKWTGGQVDKWIGGQMEGCIFIWMDEWMLGYEEWMGLWKAGLWELYLYALRGSPS